MAVDSLEKVFDLGTTKNGLHFSSDSASLISCYSNQLAAYRARKQWKEILQNYFLLDNERDYQISVARSVQNKNHFIVTCEFDSACGRYAFWRIINNQSPEAEHMLSIDSIGITTSDSYEYALHNNKEAEWLYSSDDADKPKSFMNYLSNFLKTN